MSSGGSEGWISTCVHTWSKYSTETSQVMFTFVFFGQTNLIARTVNVSTY